MSVKFDKHDINAVANGRFFRKSGQKLLMLMAIIILGLAMVVNYTPVPTYLYYGAIAVVGIVFFYMYAKKQAIARKELWDQINGNGREEKTTEIEPELNEAKKI